MSNRYTVMADWQFPPTSVKAVVAPVVIESDVLTIGLAHVGRVTPPLPSNNSITST